MTDLASLPWDSISTVGLAVFVMGLVVSGRLVPRATLRAITADLRERITYVETEAAEHRGTISSLVAQNAELSVSGRLSVALLQSINSGNAAQSGSTHVASSIPE